MLFFDIKHTDSALHKKYTGVDNALILKNLDQLKNSQKPFIARIPLILGVNDGRENLKATASLLKDAKNLIRVELLPYNGAAPAKYSMVGKSFTQSFIAPATENIDISIFTDEGITCKIM
jgi:pyruvate formate lyase activating enzyme